MLRVLLADDPEPRRAQLEAGLVQNEVEFRLVGTLPELLVQVGAFRPHAVLLAQFGHRLGPLRQVVQSLRLAGQPTPVFLIGDRNRSNRVRSGGAEALLGLPVGDWGAFTWRLRQGCIRGAEPSSRSADLRGMRVLHVDDEALLLSCYRRGMSRYRGAEVVNASTNDVALGLLEGVDLVITDQMRAGGSGTELLPRLRDRGFEGPVVMVSGFASELRDHPGFAAVLSKPVGEEFWPLLGEFVPDRRPADATGLKVVCLGVEPELPGADCFTTSRPSAAVNRLRDHDVAITDDPMLARHARVRGDHTPIVVVGAPSVALAHGADGYLEDLDEALDWVAPLGHGRAIQLAQERMLLAAWRQRDA